MNTAGIRHTLGFFADLDLLDPRDVGRITWLFDESFPFRLQRELADSIHIHIKVADTNALPDDAILNANAKTENRQPGYVKYVFDSGVNVIFSSIPVAEDDRLPDAPVITRPFLDHVGLDMRQENTKVRRQFDAVAKIAAQKAWTSVAQGGNGLEVFCCHTQVAEKRWVFPPENLLTWQRPIEFAYGLLVAHAASMGCDLRPRDPSRKLRAEIVELAPCCESSTSSISCCPSAKLSGE